MRAIKPSTTEKTFFSTYLNIIPINSCTNLFDFILSIRCEKFFEFIQDYEVNNSKTQEGLGPNIPFKDYVIKFSLEPNTVDFIGHVVALYTSDNFLEEKAITTVEKMQLYFNSFGRYGDSPFIYPVYGLSGLAEVFSRLCALYFNPSSIF